jgi:2-keto-4-pentenoate hydratase
MSIVDRAGEILRVAEESRTAVGPVSDLAPDGLSLELAHEICEANLQKRLSGGERVAGFKIGSTNLRVREAMGLPDSTYGYLTNTMVLPGGCELPLDAFISPRIECEICFRLGKDLNGSGATLEQVLNATDAVSASFEICDSRIKGWKCPYPDWFADNGFAARVVVPGVWVPVTAVDLPGEAVVLTKDGTPIAAGAGELVMGHPARAVAWLARKLSERGRHLSAGDLVMTGSLTPVLPIERATYVASFSTLGTVESTFV